MFNHVKSVGCIFSLLPRLVGFVLVGKLASFGAGNSESCLSQFSGKREVRVVGSIRKLILGFGLEQSKFEVVFQIYESFQFFRSWLLFVSQR